MVRQWEGFRSYDPETGDATTFYGKEATSGAMIQVEGATVRVAGQYDESEGLSSDPDDPEVEVVLAATCSEG